MIEHDEQFKSLTDAWHLAAVQRKYAYNFKWLGRPIIQIPQDIYAIQEIVWTVQPDLIIETGIAHGGSLVLSASMLALLDYCEACEAVRHEGRYRARQPPRKVVGVDIDIRSHNREALATHPLTHFIHCVEGSSVAPEIIRQVHELARGHERVLIFLDSNHTHDHVLAELEAYAPLTSRGSYCVVWDTGIEDLPDGTVTDRPWGKGNNPKTAVRAYLNRLAETSKQGADAQDLLFEIDHEIEQRLVFTAAPDGFLRRR